MTKQILLDSLRGYLWGRSWTARGMKTTFNGRRPLMEDNLRWKTTFDLRRSSMEDKLRWKTIFDGRRPSIGCIVYYLKKRFTTPHLGSHSTTVPEAEFLSAVQTGNRISLDWRNVRGIIHVHVCRKDDIFRQRRLCHSGVWGGLHLEECTRPEVTQP